MSWVLWLCIASASGAEACEVRRWVMPSRAVCAEQLAGLRIVHAAGSVVVQQATSVEVARAPAAVAVVAACVQEPKR
jgi:hypothetical protein